MIFTIKTDWTQNQDKNWVLSMTSPQGGVMELALVVKDGEMYRWFCKGSTGTAHHIGDARQIAAKRMGFDTHDGFVGFLRKHDYKWINIDSITTVKDYWACPR